MPKRKNVSKYFVQDCLKIFLLLLTVLKTHGNSKKDETLAKKEKILIITTLFQFELKLSGLKSEESVIPRGLYELEIKRFFR